MNGVERSNDGVVLKRCPFCGGEAEFVRDIERKDIFQSSDYVYVRCKQCQVQTKKIYYSAELHKLDEEYVLAEKAWNNRKPVERVIKRLEDNSFWTEATFDEDGYCNDDSEKVIGLGVAIEIIRQEMM